MYNHNLINTELAIYNYQKFYFIGNTQDCITSRILAHQEVDEELTTKFHF